MHALDLQTAWALVTPVVHLFPHVPQLFGSLVVSTHVPEVPVEQRVGATGGHVPTHVEPEQAAAPPPQAWPHAPQLPGSLAMLTHDPLQSVYGLMHERPHTPPLQVGCALATPVLHTFAQLPQFWGSLCLSTHAAPQSTWDPGQLATHVAGEPPSAEAQTGVPASALQPFPQPPQLLLVFSGTHAPLQTAYPWSHAMVHALLTHTGSAWGTEVVHAVQAATPVPHAVAVLVGSTQEPLHKIVVPGQLAAHAYVAPAAAQTGVPASAVHACPHEPQLAPDEKETHAPLQEL